MNTKATLHSCLSCTAKPADTAPRRSPNSTLIALAVSLALCTQVSVAAAHPDSSTSIGKISPRPDSIAAQSGSAEKTIPFLLFGHRCCQKLKRIKGELPNSASPVAQGTGLTYRV